MALSCLPRGYRAPNVCQYVVATTRDENQQQGDDRDAGDLRIHWVFARFETNSKPASSKKFATIDEPPYETNGSVMPVSGMIRRTPPTMMNVCSANPNVRPAAAAGESVVGLQGDLHAPRDEEHEDEEQGRGADQPKLLRQG